MGQELLAQADALPGGFYVPGAESLPGWVMGLGALFYVLILAYNAASNFSASRKNTDQEIDRAGKSSSGVPSDVIVTGAAFADRQALSTLAEGMENLAEALRECLSEKSPALFAVNAVATAMVRMAMVYEKRVEMDERDAREAEIRRRVEEELRRKNGQA